MVQGASITEVLCSFVVSLKKNRCTNSCVACDFICHEVIWRHWNDGGLVGIGRLCSYNWTEIRTWVIYNSPWYSQDEIFNPYPRFKYGLVKPLLELHKLIAYSANLCNRDAPGVPRIIVSCRWYKGLVDTEYAISTDSDCGGVAAALDINLAGADPLCIRYPSIINIVRAEVLPLNGAMSSAHTLQITKWNTISLNFLCFHIHFDG